MSQYSISYNSRQLSCRDNETILEAFHRQGVTLSFSCSKGSCQVCMMQCDEGRIPPDSQHGLSPDYIDKGYFLPCSCYPVSNMHLQDIPANAQFQIGLVDRKEILSDTICRLYIEPSRALDYLPGQYINLRRPDDGLTRSYSLASIPEDYFLELHIRRMQNGRMSSWIFDKLEPGVEIEIQGTMGNCCYAPDMNSDSPLVLAGRGTGMAPLIGVLRDALQHGHSGPIHAYHAGADNSDLYLQQELSALAGVYRNIRYYECLDDALPPTSVTSPLAEAIASLQTDIQNGIAYLAGSGDFIDSTIDILRRQGIPDAHIYTDRYEYRDLRQENRHFRLRSGRNSADTGTSGNLPNTLIAPNEEMWQALEQGKKLKLILDDFYSRVYQDPKLSGFFKNSTQQRSSEKQYLFMRQLFSGEKVYFGDRPRNAHHWMVIRNDLFNYRENLLATCLRDHGIAEHLVRRWMAIDETFRRDIVKTKAWPKRINSTDMPLDGFETMDIDVGTICDGCSQPIEAGETVRYHVRLGHTYCRQCMETNACSQDLTHAG